MINHVNDDLQCCFSKPSAKVLVVRSDGFPLPRSLLTPFSHESLRQVEEIMDVSSSVKLIMGNLHEFYGEVKRAAIKSVTSKPYPTPFKISTIELVL
ncbi:hypothetical protein [Escherichia coli]|uniref:hypothetical protein n=1 Tax=Escherichia coli TaxID=562 RepID=UPI0029CA3749|nr:hypothetical protein [Escherichia coli]